MSNDTPSRTILAGLFAGTDADDDSAFDSDFEVRSNETGGDSLFDELSLASGDVLDIYGQPKGRDGDDSDDDSHSEAADSGDRSLDRAPTRRANGDVAGSSPVAHSATGRPTRAGRAGQRPPETVVVAQVATSPNNNAPSGDFEPETGPPPKRSRPAPRADEVKEVDLLVIVLMPSWKKF